MRGGGTARLVRIALVALVAICLAAVVVRSAAVADREQHPALADTLWPSHPYILTDKVLLAVASAAASGHPVPEATRSDVRLVAKRAPLSPDPFLIEGAIAQTEGHGARAEALFLAARGRDPRSRGARYLLAERYARTDRVSAALTEIQVLTSLHERGGDPFIPMLVEYARTPGSGPHLRAFFARRPALEFSVLSVLAQDARNAGLVQSLASGRDPNPDWRAILVSALVGGGEVERAYATWLRLYRIGNRSPLFNPGFATAGPAGPFNWQYPQSPEGIAEPDGSGGLELLHYGRANAVLAQQLLSLQPGRYELSHTAGDVSGDAVSYHWIVRCAAPASAIANVPLGPKGASFAFEVPAGCQGVWLELQGVQADSPRTTGLTVRKLSLHPGRPA